MLQTSASPTNCRPEQVEGSQRDACHAAYLGAALPVVERARHAVPLLGIGVRQFSLSKWRPQ